MSSFLLNKGHDLAQIASNWQPWRAWPNSKV
jgi:hypothetical protein